MTDKPSLLILAAGLGSRYGGLKQLDAVGPGGETIMEFSVHDAIRAGFGRVVFVIGEDHQSRFDALIRSRFATEIPIETVVQRTSDLTEGFRPCRRRQKPWGTGQAVLAARRALTRPFVVINADDFYGAEAFKLLHRALKDAAANPFEFFLVGYRLENTLSEHGSVSRGICRVRDGYLVEVIEHTHIRRENGRIISWADGRPVPLDPDTIVSMNCWGFSPVVFDILERHFRTFLRQSLNSDTDEFFLTDPLDRAIQENQIQIRVLPTAAQWMGVTYPEDKETVRAGISAIVSRGDYPAKLN